MIAHILFPILDFGGLLYAARAVVIVVVACFLPEDRDV